MENSHIKRIAAEYGETALANFIMDERLKQARVDYDEIQRQLLAAHETIRSQDRVIAELQEQVAPNRKMNRRVR